MITMYLASKDTPNSEKQIIHSQGIHLIVACVLFSEVRSVDIYDSLYDTLDDETYLFNNKNIEIKMIKVQKQKV